MSDIRRLSPLKRQKKPPKRAEIYGLVASEMGTAGDVHIAQRGQVIHTCHYGIDRLHEWSVRRREVQRKIKRPACACTHADRKERP